MKPFFVISAFLCLLSVQACKKDLPEQPPVKTPVLEITTGDIVADPSGEECSLVYTITDEVEGGTAFRRVVPISILPCLDAIFKPCCRYIRDDNKAFFYNFSAVLVRFDGRSADIYASGACYRRTDEPCRVCDCGCIAAGQDDND